MLVIVLRGDCIDLETGPECNKFHTVDARYDYWFIVLLLLVGSTTVGNYSDF